ncbi:MULTISPECIES: hypothetical protein [unclassified Streptomyces]|uniref:hypothetical protein n=1 Tax=unclassified Streptomyces TaxID=2593676 RepID=UPI002DD91643|nr:hypothetical protein [Streptomyces sp. NBC_01766]WSC18454.1 hypothetical protein OIE60_01655 [Streptomyces sp. NBC_01766]WSV52494.1 hypothetical protein OG282_01715 [Streptomyces sp. NBC_01014]
MATRRELTEETGLDPSAVLDRSVPVERDVGWRGSCTAERNIASLRSSATSNHRSCGPVRSLMNRPTWTRTSGWRGRTRRRGT